MNFYHDSVSVLKFGANSYLNEIKNSLEPLNHVGEPKLQAGMSDFINIEPIAQKFFDDSGAINFNAMGSFLSITIWGIFIAKARQGLAAVGDSSAAKSSYTNFISLFVLLGVAALSKFAT